MQQCNIKESEKELILIPKAERYIQYMVEVIIKLKMQCRRF